jgi:hypothetical protein
MPEYRMDCLGTRRAGFQDDRLFRGQGTTRRTRQQVAVSPCFSLNLATLSNLVAHRLGWHLRKLNATMNSFQYAFLHSALQNSAFSSGCQPE